MALNGQSIMLQVNDMTDSIIYYESVLGFQCVGQMENDWARLERDDISVMFSCRYGEDKERPLRMTASIYFFANPVDELWEEYKDKVKIAYPIETFDYGMREFAVYDCNGYMLQFGQGVE